MARMRIVAVLAALVVGLTGCASAGGGRDAVIDPNTYFDGETVTIVVPFSPGGSSDVMARLIAAALPAHLPGNPTVIVENVPGGGGASGVQRLMSRRADGFTLVLATSGNIMRWRLGEPGHDYPLDRMRLIGAPDTGTAITVVRTDRATSIDGLADGGPIRAGNTSAGSTLALEQMLQARFLDADLEQVFGFEGIADVAAALQRDEVAVASVPLPSYLTSFRALVDDGTLTPIYQNGVLAADGSVSRVEAIAEIPTFAEELERRSGIGLDGADGDAYRLLIATDTIGAVLLSHPDVPDAAVAAYRDALAGMAESPEWRDRTDTSFGFEIDMLETAAAEAALQRVVEADPATIETLTALTGGSS